jgi:molybdopterin molybdotransferase
MSSQKTQHPTSCADSTEPGTLSVEDARKRILQQIAPVSGYEKVAIRAALGRILDEPVISPVNVPAHRNSAMDGFAVRGDALPDTGATAEFACVGTVYAGHPFAVEVGEGECVRIMTGAPMPEALDTVIMQEQAEFDGQTLCIGDGHRAGQNVRQAGEDMAQGSVVFAPGRKMTAADLGVVASLGIAELAVKRRPVVAFFSTGDELRSISEPLGEGEIYDSNRYTLYGMLAGLGVDMLDMGVIADEPDAMRRAFNDAADHADMIITSGGVSVGEADYIKPILQELGEITFWKIAMKPGRPLTFGKLGKAAFVGLPGNPVAVMVAFYQFALPALQYMMSGERREPFLVNAVATTQIRKRPGRTEFARGTASHGERGTLEVDVTGKQGSGILTSMSYGNCFIILPPEQGTVEPGDIVTIQPFSTLD